MLHRQYSMATSCYLGHALALLFALHPVAGASLLAGDEPPDAPRAASKKRTQPPASTKTDNHMAVRGDRREVRKEAKADKQEQEQEKDPNDVIGDPWVVKLLQHCRAVAAEKTDIQAMLKTFPLFDHLSLIVPFTKNGIFYACKGAGAMEYAPGRVELISQSRRTLDMVDSKFAYAAKEDGEWERLDPRRMNEYHGIAIRTERRLFLIDVKADKVLILRLKRTTGEGYK